LIEKKINKEIFNLSSKGTVTVDDILLLANRNIPTNPEVKPVHYEIALDKISQYETLNDSYSLVQAFITNEANK
ncbi:MAG: hypothetical protein RLY82_908, partial [Pseudomonadota bacterium]